MKGHIVGSLITLIVLAGLLVTPACQGLGNSNQDVIEQNSDSQTGSIPPGLQGQAGTGTTQAGNATITPATVTVGNVSMVLTVDTAQYMFDPAKQSDSSEDSDTSSSSKQSSNNKKTADAKGSAVVGGSMIRITNNFDPSQNPPSDSDKGQMLRHVAVQVKDKTTGQVVPYLLVSMDILRDGKPVLADQGLAPLVPADGNVNQLRYGNNVQFPRKGNYQVFIRTQSSPLLGAEVPPIAQFNVIFQ
ncbi:MAG: hypothetical protein EPO21_08220 [Chloroflexota bacterium]|nr:MAG: hypothetical protein EPO21_08220 [Chloroflexota bacterium]